MKCTSLVNNRIKRWAIPIMMIAICFPFCLSAQTVKLDTLRLTTATNYPLDLSDKNIGVFCDTTHQMLLSEIQSLDASAFQHTNNHSYKLNVVHRDHYWFRFVIQNDTEEDLDIALHYGRADIATLYKKINTNITSSQNGEKLSLQKRVYPNARYFPIQIPAKQTAEFTFRVHTVFDTFHQYDFSLYNEKKFNQKIIEEVPERFIRHLAQGMFFGFAFFVIIFSLIQFYLESDRAYLYYALYLIGVFFYYLIKTGYKITTPFSYALETSYPFSTFVAFSIFLTYACFIKVYLNINKETSFLLNLIINISMLLISFLMMADITLRLIDNTLLAIKLHYTSRAFLFPIAFLVVFVIIGSMRQNKLAIYIITGTLVLLLFGILSMKTSDLRVWAQNHQSHALVKSVTPLLYLPISFTQIGILFEIVFFSLGLSFRSKEKVIAAEQKEMKSNLKLLNAEKVTIEVNKMLVEEKMSRLEAEKEKAIFRQELAETELKALRAQINPHFISNSLNSIKLLIQNKEDQKAADYLATFSNLIRTILHNSNEMFISLQKELDFCQLYLEIESLRFNNGFTYRFDIDPTIDTTYVKLPSLILQPYLENAIWHGLLPKKQDRKLDIVVKQIEDTIYCTIEDNGVGRIAKIKNKSNAIQKKSMGMSITKERIKVSNELYDTNLKVNIIDKVDQHKKPIGTIVELIIPI